VRKLIVIAAIVLAATTAEARETRSLTRADVQVAATDQAKTVDKSSGATNTSEVATAPDVAKPADPPKFVARPAAVEPTPSQVAPTATTQPDTTDAAKLSTAKTVKADKPRHRQRDWTESRIIGELHRHGIYW
jgi:hypothetical protein